MSFALPQVLVFYALVFLVTYGVTRSSLFLIPRVWLRTNLHWALDPLLSCPVCFGTWATIALYLCGLYPHHTVLGVFEPIAVFVTVSVTLGAFGVLAADEREEEVVEALRGGGRPDE